MSSKQVSQWRTVMVVTLFGALLFVGFIVLVVRQTPPGDGAVRLFDLLSSGLFLFAVTAAGKSATEHLAGGGGLKGAARSLMTDAKPGDPASPTLPPSGGAS